MATWLEILLGVIYLAALIFLGGTTLRRGHFMFFLVGIFLPFLWIFGALLPPTRRAREVQRQAEAGSA